MNTDHERIYLEPRSSVPFTRRLWCEDDVWTGDPDYPDYPATEYVRADLVEERVRRLVEALRRYVRMDEAGCVEDGDSGALDQARRALATRTSEPEPGVGTSFRNWRVGRGLSLRETAAMLGVTPVRLGEFERAVVPVTPEEET